MSSNSSSTEPYRPWLKSYPDGIDWDTPIDTTPVHIQVLKACDIAPDNPAMDFLGAKTSFKDFKQQIIAFAGVLQTEFGVKKGSRVAILLPNTPFYPIAYYAILLVGGTVVNCNPLYTTKELTHITKNSGADILITLDLKAVFEKAEALCKNGIVQKLIVCHFPEALPTVKRVLFSVAKRKDMVRPEDSSVYASVSHFRELVNKGIEPKPVEIDPAVDIAVQQYTGGTTGIPKGALLSHANIAANVDQIDKWGCGIFYPPSKVVAVLPFFHIFAMTVCMNVPLSNGTEVVMLPRFDLPGFLDLMVRTQPNILPSVPTLLHAIAVNRKTKPEIMASLEVAISGGAGLPSETREAFNKISAATLAEGYGLTECSPVLCCAGLRVPSRPMSIGMPIPGTDIRFVDLKDPTKQVAPGERGELVAKGPQIMVGYHQEPEASASAFVDGYFRTGDVGYVDEDGYVFLVDRIKDLIICSGFNVYPRGIEEAIMHHPDVDECNVIGVPDSYRGEAPVAFVKLKQGRSMGAADMKQFLSKHISKIEIPRDVIFKDELPKTFIGKLSKKELREEYAAIK